MARDNQVEEVDERRSLSDFENLYFTRMNISGSKRNKNNKINNLTINMNIQHVQHDEVGFCIFVRKLRSNVFYACCDFN